MFSCTLSGLCRSMRAFFASALTIDSKYGLHCAVHTFRSPKHMDLARVADRCTGKSQTISTQAPKFFRCFLNDDLR